MANAVNTAHTPQTGSTSQEIDLPAPQIFDILPALHELLARIEHSSSDTSSIADFHDSSERNGEIGALYTDLAPLEPKDLPNEALQIKAKIRTALKALEKLPDMDRSVEEQQVEIEQLDARIAKQRAMIRKLGEVAKGLEGRLG